MANVDLAQFADNIDKSFNKNNRDQNSIARKTKAFARTANIVLVGLFALVQLFPLVWMVNYSLTTSAAVYGDSILVWPEEFMWDNYVKAWTSGNVARYGLNTLIVVPGSVLLSLFITMLLSYAFTRMQWKLRSAFYGITMLGLMIPLHVTLLPNYLSFQALGIADSYWGLIIPYTAFNLPFGVFMMTSFIKSNPVSVEEAAIIDGASVWRVVFQIVAPMVAPALITVAIMDFLSCWNEFIMAAIFISKETLKTLPFSIYLFQGAYMSDYAVQFAVLTIVAMPPVIAYLLMSKKMTKGIMLGAIKE